jgi:hypothetical protein
MLGWCDAMDMQWKDNLELILLVGLFTTSCNSRRNRSIIIYSISNLASSEIFKIRDRTDCCKDIQTRLSITSS